MAYEKTDWESRVGSDLDRFEKANETAKSVLLRNRPNAVTRAGTPFSVKNMNKIEQGIYDAHEITLAHKEDPYSHPDIRAIINQFVGLPVWNSDNYSLIFTAKDGSTLEVDLPLEDLARDIDFDPATKEIILFKHDGSEIRIDVGDLVDVYTGSIGTHIQITIGEGNQIKAILRGGSITEAELSAALLAKINSVDAEPAQNSNNPVKSGGVYAWFGAALSTLQTTAKTVIGAINELFNGKLGTAHNTDTAAHSTQFGNKVNKAGDTMSGSLNMNSNKITSLATPTVDADAATKKYVDDKLSSSAPTFITGTKSYAVSSAATWDTAINDIKNNASKFQDAIVEINISASFTANILSPPDYKLLDIPEGVKKFVIKSVSTTVYTLTISSNYSISGHFGCEFEISSIRLSSNANPNNFVIDKFASLNISDYFYNGYLSLTLNNINTLILQNYLNLTGGTVRLYNIPLVNCSYNGNVFQGTLAATNCNFYLTGGTSARLTNSSKQNILDNCLIFNNNVLTPPSKTDSVAAGATKTIKIFENASAAETSLWEVVIYTTTGYYSFFRVFIRSTADGGGNCSPQQTYSYGQPPTITFSNSTQYSFDITSSSALLLKMVRIM